MHRKQILKPSKEPQNMVLNINNPADLLQSIQVSGYLTEQKLERKCFLWKEEEIVFKKAYMHIYSS